MSVDRVLDLITTLTLEEAQRVAVALRAYIMQIEAWQQPDANVVEQHTTAGGCYRLEFVKCGKASCKCVSGNRHGPYWYFYLYRPGGGQRKTYIGKQRPAQLTESPVAVTPVAAQLAESPLAEPPANPPEYARAVQGGWRWRLEKP